MRPSSAEMFANLAGALRTGPEDDAAFGIALAGFLRTLVRFDTCVVFAYRDEAPPIVLFHTFTPEQFRVHVTLYCPAAFRLDPFHHAARSRRLGFWRMRELAPDRFFQSEYFRSYYFETGLAEEVGFFAGADETTVVVLSLMRLNETGPFSRSDAALLRACEPVVRALMTRHWHKAGTRFVPEAKPGQRHASRRVPLRQIGTAPWMKLGLTGREAGIVDLVLQGHSSESIAGRLAIAPGTVKVHRRNIYRKLCISSQTELLALYVDRIVEPALVA